MISFRRRYPLWGLLLLLGAILCTGALGWRNHRLLQEVERHVMDGYRSFFFRDIPGRNIVLVLARERSFQELGLWPWPRNIHGRVVQRLKEARTVVLDMIFPERGNLSGDAFLASAVREHGNCVVGVHLAEEGGEIYPIFPYAGLAESARYLGVTNVLPDVDGLYRFTVPFWNIGKGSLPSVALAACMADTGQMPEPVTTKKGMAMRFGSRTFPLVQPWSSIWIAPIDVTAYPVYEYVDVLKGAVKPELFKDALVLVGVNASGGIVQDVLSIPWKREIKSIPGAAVVASSVETLLSTEPLRHASRAAVVAVTLGAALLAACGGLFAAPRRSWIIMGLLELLLGGMPWLLLKYEHFWFPPPVPAAGVLLAYFSALGLRLFRMDRSVRMGGFYTQVLSVLYNLEGSKGGWQSAEQYLDVIWPEIEEITSIALLDKHARGGRVQELLGERGHLISQDSEASFLRVRSKTHPYRLFIRPASGWGGVLELGWKHLSSEDDVRSAAGVAVAVSWFAVALKREEERLQAFEGAIKAVVASVDAKDPDTGGHSERVASLTRALGEALDCSRSFLQELYFGALLHDVGKIGIPDAVLRKPGKLTPEEFENIKRHPLMGYDILSSVALPEVAFQGILEHHEKLDGSGYPRGLRGEDISLAGRIVAVADTFDALSSRRTYKEEWSLERIFAYFREEQGVRYDMQVVDALLSLGEDWYREHAPSSGETAEEKEHEE